MPESATVPALARRHTRWAGWIVSVSAVLSMSSCNLDSNFGDLGEKLLDPEVQALDTPGQRMLAGPHVSLSIQSDEGGTRYAVARNDKSELVIVDFAAEAHCRAGVVFHYGNAIEGEGIGQPTVLPFLERDDTSGALTLGFARLNCQRLPLKVEVAGLPLNTVGGQSEGSGRAVLVPSADGRLLLIDPWAETVRVVAERLDAGPRSEFNHFWWIDGGQLVVADAQLKVLGKSGSNVVEVQTSAAAAELAYIEAGAEGRAGGRLLVASAISPDTPELIESNACEVRYLNVGGRRQLGYLAPCEQRRLVFNDRQSGEVRVIADDVVGPPTQRTIAGQSYLIYVTGDTTHGTLWGVVGNEDAVVIAEDARVGPSVVAQDGGLLTLVNWTTTGGRLVKWKPQTLTTVAESVMALLPAGRMANGDPTLLSGFDGTSGNLVRLRDDSSLEHLAGGVPLRSVNGDAFIANFDGDGGDLLLLDRASGETESLAANVLLGSFRFAQQFGGVYMLTDRSADDGTSTLRLTLLETGKQFEVNAGVTEAQEVSFPSPGLLYNVVTGDNAGIWFARTL